MSEESKETKQCCGGHGGHEGGCCCGHHHEDVAESQTDATQCGCGGESKPAFEMPQDVPLPAPTLLTLASSIATQAMVSMGIFPSPLTGKSEFYLHQAKHLIDTVDLIIQKTEGNRTDEESKTLAGMLSELQMLFVAAGNEKKKREEK